MNSETTLPQTKQGWSLGNLFTELRERADAALHMERKTSFKDSVADSFWMFLPYTVLSIPLEIFINKSIIPGLNKIYRKITGNPEAEIPQIAQSIFKGLGLFAWFPAIVMADSTKRFFKYDEEVVEPEVKMTLLSGIAASIMNRRDVTLSEPELPKKGSNTITRLLEASVAGHDSDDHDKSLKRALDIVAEAQHTLETAPGKGGTNTAALKELAESLTTLSTALIHNAEHQRVRNETLVSALSVKTEERLGQMLKEFAPKLEDGFLARVMDEKQNPSASDIQSALLLLHGLLFYNLKCSTDDTRAVASAIDNPEQNKICRTLRAAIKMNEQGLANPSTPEENLTAHRNIAITGLSAALAVIRTAKGISVSDEALEGLVDCFDYSALSKNVRQAGIAF